MSYVEYILTGSGQVAARIDRREDEKGMVGVKMTVKALSGNADLSVVGFKERYSLSDDRVVGVKARTRDDGSVFVQPAVRCFVQSMTENGNPVETLDDNCFAVNNKVSTRLINQALRQAAST